MTDDTYRFELRNEFMGQMKNSQFHNTTQNYKEHSMRAQQKMNDFESAYNDQRRQVQQQLQQQQPKSPSALSQTQRQSGGDADRLGFDSHFLSKCGGESCRHSSDNYSGRHRSSKPKETKQKTPSISTKYADDAINFMYDTDSNAEVHHASEDSSRSMKSSRTVVSKRSSRDLRKIVKSQCKLHEVIDETLKQMCHGDVDTQVEEKDKYKIKDPPVQVPAIQLPPLSAMQVHCKHCTEKLLTRTGQKDVTNEIDEVVNSKVINPMIRKLQRMYLNNLREEMSLMEDLERLPHKVSEVYKAAIYKNKD